MKALTLAIMLESKLFESTPVCYFPSLSWLSDNLVLCLEILTSSKSKQELELCLMIVYYHLTNTLSL